MSDPIQQMNAAAECLRTLGESLVQKGLSGPYKAEGTTTHCNQAVHEAMQAFGCAAAFESAPGVPVLANEMVNRLQTNPDFVVIRGYADAQQLQNAGDLVIYGVQLAGHGHVCIGMPSPTNPKQPRMVFSAKYGDNVPFVANVGPLDYTKVCGMNYAFSPKNKPTLYHYAPKGKLTV